MFSNSPSFSHPLSYSLKGTICLCSATSEPSSEIVRSTEGDNMGSLMFGWDILPDPEKVIKRSKTSLTNEEIEEFWHHQQEEIEAHTKEINDQDANTLPVVSKTKLSVRTTTANADGIETEEVVVEEWPQPTASSPDWWTRSNWAYLNAPPEVPDIPGQSYHRPYVPQHDVATRINRSESSLV